MSVTNYYFLYFMMGFVFCAFVIGAQNESGANIIEENTENLSKTQQWFMHFFVVFFMVVFWPAMLAISLRKK